LKQVAAVGSDLLGKNSVFVIVNDGFKERKPPTGRREHPVENLQKNKEKIKGKTERKSNRGDRGEREDEEEVRGICNNKSSVCPFTVLVRDEHTVRTYVLKYRLLYTQIVHRQAKSTNFIRNLYVRLVRMGSTYGLYAQLVRTYVL
jgi:hypothetical protein